MCKILIIYHSQAGNTKKMAEHVAKGAQSIDNVNVILKRATGATLQDLIECNMNRKCGSKYECML